MIAKVRTPALPENVRLVREPVPGASAPVKIDNPEDAYRFMAPRMNAEEVEVFYVLCLDKQNQVRGVVEVSRGLVDASIVAPREVFRIAIAMNASHIVVLHNHPSGNPTPSAEDRQVTRNLEAAGRILEIPLLDHVIVAGDKYTSFAEQGLMP